MPATKLKKNSQNRFKKTSEGFFLNPVGLVEVSGVYMMPSFRVLGLHKDYPTMTTEEKQKIRYHLAKFYDGMFYAEQFDSGREAARLVYEETPHIYHVESMGKEVESARYVSFIDIRAIALIDTVIPNFELEPAFDAILKDAVMFAWENSENVFDYVRMENDLSEKGMRSPHLSAASRSLNNAQHHIIKKGRPVTGHLSQKNLDLTREKLQGIITKRETTKEETPLETKKDTTLLPIVKFEGEYYAPLNYIHFHVQSYLNIVRETISNRLRRQDDRIVWNVKNTGPIGDKIVLKNPHINLEDFNPLHARYVLINLNHLSKTVIDQTGLDYARFEEWVLNSIVSLEDEDMSADLLDIVGRWSDEATQQPVTQSEPLFTVEEEKETSSNPLDEMLANYVTGKGKELADNVDEPSTVPPESNQEILETLGKQVKKDYYYEQKEDASEETVTLVSPKKVSLEDLEEELGSIDEDLLRLTQRRKKVHNAVAALKELGL